MRQLLDYSGQVTTSGFQLSADYPYRGNGIRCRAHASVEAFGHSGEIPATVSASTTCSNGTRCSGTYVGTMVLETGS